MEENKQLEKGLEKGRQKHGKLIFISSFLSKKIYNQLNPSSDFEAVKTGKVVIKASTILLVTFFWGIKAAFLLILIYLLFNLIDTCVTEKKLILNDLELGELRLYRKMYIISSVIVILILIIR